MNAETATVTQSMPDAQLHLRPPETVLRLDRMGSFHQTRLSFMRVLLRRLARENWQVARVLFEIDARGEGVAVYEARGNGRVYSLVAFGHDLDPALRTDRVIAEAWDATFTLHDGVASRADIERLSRNVPKQEAGRCTPSEIVLARANRSVRLFDQVVATLAAGRQPEMRDLDAVGYLMRTTAVYGSGKFGLADRDSIADRREFAGPFSAEMLTVWLIRGFIADLVEHMARLRAPDTAVPFDPALKRRLGVGNSTGLGMAPFVVNHPSLFHRWISARETALARVRAVELATPEAIATFRDRLTRGIAQVAAWRVDDAIQTERINGLSKDLAMLSRHVEAADLSAPLAWDALYRHAEARLGMEAQEFLLTLLLEPYGELVDDLADTMAGEELSSFRIDGSITVGALRQAIARSYRDALGTDFAEPAAQARFWYVSEEKLEPRLGERAQEEGAALEQPLAVGRDVARLDHDLGQQRSDATAADFLSAHPEYRHAVRRVQTTARLPYAEIRDNLISATMRPVDILRCKLSFFGATDFDPRSDRWVRISMFKHAPLPDELGKATTDDWAIPPVRHVAAGGAPRPVAGWTPADDVERPAGFSLGEIEAQAKKAARGAGLPWGLAEEAGRLARQLAYAAPENLAGFADALDEIRAGRHGWRLEAAGEDIHGQDERPVSALAVAPAILDRLNLLLSGATLSLAGPIVRPQLLAPILADIAERSGRSVRIRAGDRTVVLGADAGEAASALIGLGSTQERPMSIALGDRLVAKPRRHASAGVQIDPSLWLRLDTLAALTYVPASETSRLAGAGAGLRDND